MDNKWYIMKPCQGGMSRRLRVELEHPVFVSREENL